MFRTVVVDKAGGIPWCRPIAAELVDTDIAGTALLLTESRAHLRFPVHALHKPTDGITEMLKACSGVAHALKAFAAEDFSYVGGQELIWDVHSAVAAATFRHLTVDEIAEVLADSDARVDTVA